MQQLKLSPAFYSSLILHVGILLLLIVNFKFSGRLLVTENIENNTNVISAVAVNMPPIPNATPNPPAPSPIKQELPKPAMPRPEPSKQLIEEQKLRELQQEIQKERVIAINEAKKKRLEEQKKILAQKKQLAKEKIFKHKALEAAMAQELKAQTAETLQQQLLSEQRRAAGAKSRGEVNKYKALIIQAIARRWLVPAGVDKTLSSELLIRLAPGGTVLDVQVTRSSGSTALDRSARDAVFKASPLPVPTNPDAFDTFRQFVLKVKPENVIAHDLGAL